MSSTATAASSANGPCDRINRHSPDLSALRLQQTDLQLDYYKEFCGVAKCYD
jgi:hypothetical protein